MLKKLNLGEASDHLVQYMGKYYKPQAGLIGVKSSKRLNEDEKVKKLRNFLHFLTEKKVMSVKAGAKNTN